MALGELCNLYLLISGDCNLRCTYCYAQGSGVGGRQPAAMVEKTMRAALNKLLPERTSLVISFFGGEPLLNFDLMRKTVAFGNELARQRGTSVRYALTTNGTLLEDEHLHFLRANIDYLAVSLDGGQEFTDASRRYKERDRSVYQVVANNLRRLAQAGIPYGLRGTIPEHLAGMTSAMVTHLDSLGAVALRIDPAFGIIPWHPDNHRRRLSSLAAINSHSLERVLADEKPILSSEIYRVAGSRLKEGAERHYPCLAGQGILAVAADGDTYPCDHFVGLSEFCMGNVVAADFPNQQYYRIVDKMKGNAVTNRGKCAKCRVRHMCGGECPAHSWLRQGCISKPSPDFCAGTRYLIRKMEVSLDAVLDSEASRRKILAFLES